MVVGVYGGKGRRWQGQLGDGSTCGLWLLVVHHRSCGSGFADLGTWALLFFQLNVCNQTCDCSPVANYNKILGKIYLQPTFDHKSSHKQFISNNFYNICNGIFNHGHSLKVFRKQAKFLENRPLSDWKYGPRIDLPICNRKQQRLKQLEICNHSRCR